MEAVSPLLSEGPWDKLAGLMEKKKRDIPAWKAVIVV